MKKIKIKNEKLVFGILFTALFILALLYYNFVFYTSYARNAFANEVLKIAEENENSIFNVQKLLIYSSATATDTNENQSLENISISQYTDLAIFIDNTNYISDLTAENTINQLYIDNIQIKTNADIGTKYLWYKNPLDFGKFKDFSNSSSDRIDFNIVNTNNENENHDYSQPTFYTDCSNPITLGYLNTNILNDYSVSGDTTSVSFNGKVLKEANVNLNDINYTLSFKINIVNNLNQKFTYNMSLNMNLDGQDGGIYNGYLYKGKTLTGNEYNFFKEV